VKDSRISLIGVCLVLFCQLQWAEAVEKPINEQLFELSERARLENYWNTLEALQEEQNLKPENTRLTVERCRYIQRFQDEEQLGVFLEEAMDDYQQCSQAIIKTQTNDPYFRLFELEQLWGDEAKALIDRLQEQGIESWTMQQKTALYEMAADRYQWIDESAGRLMAQKAYEYGGHPRFAIQAISLFAQDDREQAVTLLSDVKLKPQQAELANQLLELWLELGQLDRASTLYQTWKDHDDFWLSGLSKAKISLYQKELNKNDLEVISENLYSIRNDFLSLYDFALENSSGEQAAMVYRFMQQQDVVIDPVFYERARLIYQYPSQLFVSWIDVLPILIIISVLLAVLLLPGCIFIPIHYRSLIRRQNGGIRTYRLTQWNLRHAWVLVSGLLMLDLILMVVFDYRSFYVEFFSESFWGEDELSNVSPHSLSAANYLLCMDALMAALLLFFVWGGRQLYRFGNWGVGKTLTRAFLATLALWMIAFLNLKLVGGAVETFNPSSIIVQLMTHLP